MNDGTKKHSRPVFACLSLLIFILCITLVVFGMLKLGNAADYGLPDRYADYLQDDADLGDAERQLLQI